MEAETGTSTPAELPPARRRYRGKRTVQSARPPPEAPEHLHAAWWRQHVLRMTRDELALRSGYSPRAIAAFETGINTQGQPIGEDAWQRYRLTCAAVMAGLTFSWGPITIEIAG